MPNDFDDDIAALRDWFANWNKLVNALDYTGSRALFHDDVIGFGTHMDTVVGIDALERMQWRSIWSTMDNFVWILNTLKAIVSPDRLQATAVLTWSSTGYHEDGKAFPRHGRATVVLTRKKVSDLWLGSHTHVSLNPGSPQKSYGDKREKTSA
jgi:ketosteroid isomerase-like protein